MTSLRSSWQTLCDPHFDTIPGQLASSYLPSLDGLRAISIAIVIAGHLLVGGVFSWYVSGATGVQIFFAISGFLITTLLLKEQAATHTISLKRFYIRRVLRIFPVAYLFLLVMMVINQVFQLHIDRLDFLMGFLYVKNLTALHPSAWQTGHFWSLAVEEQFYLLFPFLIKYNYKLYIRLIFILLVMIPLANVYTYHGGQHLTGTTGIILEVFLDVFGSGMTSILCGSLCAILLFKRMIRPESLVRYKALAPLLVLLLMIGRIKIGVPGWEVLWLFLTGPMACAAILLSGQPGTWFYRFLNTKPLRRIGVLSYSLYIWQQIFTSHQPWAHAFPHADAAWINLPALAIVATASYYLYEKKFLRLKDRFKAAAKPAGSPAASPTHSIAL